MTPTRGRVAAGKRPRAAPPVVTLRRKAPGQRKRPSRPLRHAGQRVCWRGGRGEPRRVGARKGGTPYPSPPKRKERCGSRRSGSWTERWGTRKQGDKAGREKGWDGAAKKLYRAATTEKGGPGLAWNRKRGEAGEGPSRKCPARVCTKKTRGGEYVGSVAKRTSGQSRENGAIEHAHAPRAPQNSAANTVGRATPHPVQRA